MIGYLVNLILNFVDTLEVLSPHRHVIGVLRYNILEVNDRRAVPGAVNLRQGALAAGHPADVILGELLLDLARTNCLQDVDAFNVVFVVQRMEGGVRQRVGEVARVLVNATMGGQLPSRCLIQEVAVVDGRIKDGLVIVDVEVLELISVTLLWAQHSRHLAGVLGMLVAVVVAGHWALPRAEAT